MSLRRLRVLVRGLLRDDTSQFAKLNRERARVAGLLKETKIEDAPADALSQTEWFLLANNDELRKLNWMLRAALRKEGTQVPPPPDLIPRPGAVPKKRRTLNAWFGAVGLGPLEKPPKAPATTT